MEIPDTVSQDADLVLRYIATCEDGAAHYEMINGYTRIQWGLHSDYKQRFGEALQELRDHGLIADFTNLDGDIFDSSAWYRVTERGKHYLENGQYGRHERC